MIMFQLLEQKLDQVPFFEQPPVRWALNGTMFAARNDRIRLLFIQ